MTSKGMVASNSPPVIDISKSNPTLGSTAASPNSRIGVGGMGMSICGGSNGSSGSRPMNSCSWKLNAGPGPQRF